MGRLRGARAGLRGVVLVRTVSGSDITEGKIKKARLPSDAVYSADLAALLATLLPAGCTLPYAGASAPAGFLLCNGASVLRTSYAVLFTAIGTAYGSVDGTHFTLPDFAAAFPRGNTPAANGGAATARHR